MYLLLHLMMLEVIILKKNEFPIQIRSLTGTWGCSEMTRPVGCVIPDAVFEGSQRHFTPRWLSRDLLYVLGRVYSWPLKVRMWFIP